MIRLVHGNHRDPRLQREKAKLLARSKRCRCRWRVRRGPGDAVRRKPARRFSPLISLGFGVCTVALVIASAWRRLVPASGRSSQCWSQLIFFNAASHQYSFCMSSRSAEHRQRGGRRQTSRGTVTFRSRAAERPRCGACTGSLSASPRKRPMRRIRSACARAASGHPATPLPTSAMNSRRLMGLTPRPGSQTKYSRVLDRVSAPRIAAKAATHVRFWSKAEILDLSLRCPLYPQKRT